MATAPSICPKQATLYSNTTCEFYEEVEDKDKVEEDEDNEVIYKYKGFYDSKVGEADPL